MFHTVARGDTLSEIAERYDTRVSTLVALNRLSSSHRIRALAKLAAASRRSRAAASGRRRQSPARATPVEPGRRERCDCRAEVEVAEMTPLRWRAISHRDCRHNPDGAAVRSERLHGRCRRHVSRCNRSRRWGTMATGSKSRRSGSGTSTACVSDARRRGSTHQLDLGTVDAKTFEERRIAYHRQQQDSFFGVTSSPALPNTQSARRVHLDSRSAQVRRTDLAVSPIQSGTRSAQGPSRNHSSISRPRDVDAVDGGHGKTLLDPTIAGPADRRWRQHLVADVEQGGPYLMRNLLPLLVLLVLALLRCLAGAGHWSGAGMRMPLGTLGFAIPALGLSAVPALCLLR